MGWAIFLGKIMGGPGWSLTNHGQTFIGPVQPIRSSDTYVLVLFFFCSAVTHMFFTVWPVFPNWSVFWVRNLNAIKPMIKDEKLKSIMKLYEKLRPYKEAFPTVMSMITGALIIPVSWTNCERSFSKMKLVKRPTRNTMNDTRLSDKCLLAIERFWNRLRKSNRCFFAKSWK